MASYTMQLREYIEQATQYQSLSTKEQIERGRKKLFDFEYPIFDEDYRKVFETHFIRKFYMREIGFETEGLFKFQLETWLNIHMPYFNKMFESELIKFDPLINSQMEASHKKTTDKNQNDVKESQGSRNTDSTKLSNGTTTTDATNTSSNNQSSESTINDDNFNRHLESNNPDSRLAITTNDGEGVIQYASLINEDSENKEQRLNGSTEGNTTDVSDVDTTSSNEDVLNEDTKTSKNDTLKSDINETEDYVQSRTGKIGVQTYSKMMMEYRQSLIRVEQTIFDEMQELFMLVY